MLKQGIKFIFRIQIVIVQFWHNCFGCVYVQYWFKEKHQCNNIKHLNFRVPLRWLMCVCSDRNSILYRIWVISFNITNLGLRFTFFLRISTFFNIYIRFSGIVKWHLSDADKLSNIIVQKSGQKKPSAFLLILIEIQSSRCWWHTIIDCLFLCIHKSLYAKYSYCVEEIDLTNFTKTGSVAENSNQWFACKFNNYN